MHSRKIIAIPYIAGLAVVGVLGYSLSWPGVALTEKQRNWIMQTQRGEADPLPQTKAEWKQVLSPEQFRILRKKGTERAFSGELWDANAEGVYRCAGCGQPLFGSDTKFDSGTGWPSFWSPVSTETVSTEEDRGLFSTRTEVLCSRCGGHLGHVFDDGPQPTGQRYCINSAALHLDETVKPETGPESRED